jgi:DNA-binding NtrC family response regulator
MQDHLVSGEVPRGNQGSSDLKALLESYERSLIVEALTASGGHQRRTAARLGVLPTTLHEKMKRLGLLRRPEPATGSGTPSPSEGMRYPASGAEGRA